MERIPQPCGLDPEQRYWVTVDVFRPSACGRSNYDRNSLPKCGLLDVDRCARAERASGSDWLGCWGRHKEQRLELAELLEMAALDSGLIE